MRVLESASETLVLMLAAQGHCCQHQNAVPARAQDIRLISGPELPRWVDEVIKEISVMVMEDENGATQACVAFEEDEEGGEQWLGVSE